MDDFLHFPHFLSGNELIEWKTRGQQPETFFDDLKKQIIKLSVFWMPKSSKISDFKGLHFNPHI
jgi:hypothetical protein